MTGFGYGYEAVVSPSFTEGLVQMSERRQTALDEIRLREQEKTEAYRQKLEAINLGKLSYDENTVSPMFQQDIKNAYYNGMGKLVEAYENKRNNIDPQIKADEVAQQFGNKLKGYQQTTAQLNSLINTPDDKLTTEQSLLKQNYLQHNSSWDDFVNGATLVPNAQGSFQIDPVNKKVTVLPQTKVDLEKWSLENAKGIVPQTPEFGQAEGGYVPVTYTTKGQTDAQGNNVVDARTQQILKANPLGSPAFNTWLDDQYRQAITSGTESPYIQPIKDAKGKVISYSINKEAAQEGYQEFVRSGIETNTKQEKPELKKVSDLAERERFQLYLTQFKTEERQDDKYYQDIITETSKVLENKNVTVTVDAGTKDYLGKTVYTRVPKYSKEDIQAAQEAHDEALEGLREQEGNQKEKKIDVSEFGGTVR